MEKKDIYEHLAKIYLDNSYRSRSTAGAKRHRRHKISRTKLLLLGIIISSLIIVPTIKLISTLGNKTITPMLSKLNIGLAKNDIIRINFDFENSSFNRESYTLHFDSLNLRKYDTLLIVARKAKDRGVVNLRVKVENTIRDSSSQFINQIKNAWGTYKIKLSDFKEIREWSCIKKISFIIEDWNVQENNDIVYIDEISFLKEGG